MCKNKTNNKCFEKCVLIISIILIVSFLFYFKYFSSVVNLINNLLRLIGSNFILPLTEDDLWIEIPIGISFYTFTAISYVIDVYRDKSNQEKNIVNFATYIVYFPKIVEGPIERSKTFISQIKEKKKLNQKELFDGLLLILWGLFLKVVIADRIAIFVNTIYGDINTYSGFYLLAATVMYAFQIYCDFAGYTTIAIGISEMLGCKLTDNFNSPYLSKNISEFWRRWHISLMSWFRDYVYIPLGGNRKGELRKYTNILIVFMISGIWHGSSLSFIVWGMLNALYQIIGCLTSSIRNKIVKALKIDRNSIVHKLFCVLITFCLICFSWIFFRASSLKEALTIIQSIFTANNYNILFDDSLFGCGLDIKNFILLLLSLIVILIVDCCKYKNIVLRDIISKQHWIFKMLFIVVVICVILVFGKYGPYLDKASFIYANF